MDPNAQAHHVLKSPAEAIVSPRRRRRRIILGTIAAIAVAVFGVFWRFFFLHNFDVVDPQRGVYRSSQPRENLRGLVEEHHLASVLNLRGGSDVDSWYQHEVEVTRDLNVDFYDMPILADDRPSRCELMTLLDLLDRCRYPLLIHCKSGSDRTGLVSGLYLMSCKGEPPTQALRAFSIYRGHVPLLGPERLQEPFYEYADWLRTKGLPHTPERLRAWVEREYRDERPAANCPPLRPGPRAQVVVMPPAAKP